MGGVMLIVEALNVTPRGERMGKSDYHVNVWINDRPIWKGAVVGHTRRKGAAALLRLIADEMEADPQ